MIPTLEGATGSGRLLPGGTLVSEGIADLSRGAVTVEALLVSIGAPRFRALNWEIPATLPDAQARLYALLYASDGDAAHGRYNALVRQLVSFLGHAGMAGGLLGASTIGAMPFDDTHCHPISDRDAQTLGEVIEARNETSSHQEH